MKRETFLKTAMFAAFVGFIFCCGASMTQAQNVQPIVDCVEAERDANGALTGKYTAYFGYKNLGTNVAYIAVNSGGNVMSPVRNPPGQPDTFQPGIHSFVFSVAGLDTNSGETWRLTSYTVTTSFSQNPLCGDSQNARLTTYQGKLSDGGTAANGVYDLQFQLFNAATGGAAQTTQIAIEDVSVTNGVFTVQLDLGANSVSGNLPINPAILAGDDSFFEIGARPGNSTGAFTALTPRQPLTAVPLAMRANTANDAVRATIAGNAANLGGVAANLYVRTNASSTISGNFSISGNLSSSGDLSSGGNLNVTGTITSGCRTGFTPIANGRLCVSAMQSPAAFYGANGAIKTCANLGARVGNSADLMLTIGTSLDYRSGTASGWLADHIGNNVWAVWSNGFGETDFDGNPIDVTIGGTGGTAPILQYRCVY